MKKTIAPEPTPSPTNSFFKFDKGGKSTASPSAVFVGMALDMSWRLAIAVLVPIIGGFELDRHFNTSPLLTILGFVLAMAGMGLVMWRTLKVASQATTSKVKRP